MHLMIDIETLGTTPAAPVMEIGAVFFDRNNVYESFQSYVRPDFTRQQPDVSTLIFWNDQTIPMPLIEGAPSFPTVMRSLEGWLGDVPLEGIWANAPSFDLVILQQSALAHGMKRPFSYSLFRDCRTIFAIGKTLGVERTFPEIAHAAVEDAKAQARSIIDIHDAMLEKGIDLL
jgi:exodeoxyribonuclease VIII